MLDNGLRLVVDRLAPSRVVGLCVAFGAGMRSDPAKYPGLAHLVEHLSYGALGAHVDRVGGVGGAIAATTFTDHTEYSSVAPAATLQVLVELEARRFEPLLCSAEDIESELSVLVEEVRTEVDAHDFGGLTVREIPHLIHGCGPLAHDGYGSARSLAGVGPQDVRRFAEANYRPDNAVVAVAGDVEPDEVGRVVTRALSSVSRSGAGWARPDCGNAVPAPGTVELARGRARRPASARAATLAFVLPDLEPSADESLYRHVGAVLALRAVAERESLTCRVGVFEPVAARRPDLGSLSRYLPESWDAERLNSVVRSSLTVLANEGSADSARAAAFPWWRRMQVDNAQPLTRARSLARAVVLHGSPALPDLLARCLERASGDLLRAGARYLLAAPGALVDIGEVDRALIASSERA